MRVFPFIVSLLLTSVSFAAKIDARLRALVDGAEETSEVLVLMEYPHTNIEKYDHSGVVGFLKNSTKDNWRRIENKIRRDRPEGVTDVQIHWINNSFSAKVDREGLKALSRMPGVKKIYHNASLRLELPAETEEAPQERGLPYNFASTGLDRLIERYPDVDGRGVVIGAIDTGVDASHPALHGKVLKFFNGRENRYTEARDWGSHGTHVTGLLVGGDRENHLGTAPGAKVLMAASLVDIGTILRAMELMLDPDGDPNTDDAPKVINNSWNSIPGADQEPFYRAISAWEAAGIAVVFSAGNSGPAPRTITPPKEHPATITVAGIDEQGVIAPRSSRGPVMYKEIELKKPELSAPGERIVSTVGGGKLGVKSGTSMAAPQVTGTIALMLQVNPALTPEQVKNILISTATSVNGAEWSEAYGFGRLNALLAVEKAMASSIFPEIQFPPYLIPLTLHPPELFQRKVERGSLADALTFPARWENSAWIRLESPVAFTAQ